MHLTQDEEDILAGEAGEGRQWAMELLVGLGRIFGAEDLVPIESAQLAGVSYKTIGEPGLKWLQDVSRNSVVSVMAMLNPAGMDPNRWMEMGVPEEFAAKQRAILRAYNRMGVELTCTCTPYLIGRSPGFGEHVAWSESNAVSYCNSVLGARTNREGGPSALAAAIVGKTARYGLHLPRNRIPTAVVEVDPGDTNVDYGALGVHVGRELGDAIPYFKGINPTSDELKTLGAAMAASGAIALFHVRNVTPEAQTGIEPDRGVETLSVGPEELEDAYRSLSASLKEQDVELVTIGCPHVSIDELEEIAQFLKGKHKRDGAPDLWVCTSKEVKKLGTEAIKIIEEYGKVLVDTCMVVAPIDEVASHTATNSGKAATYLPLESFCGQKVLYRSTPLLLSLLVE
ncbi:MAG: aconitase X [Planctomycetota bacterium]|jgi:predicted aconitase